MTQDFQTMMTKQMAHLETKSRLTQAEKLLRSAYAELQRLSKANVELVETVESLTEQLAQTRENNDTMNTILGVFEGDIATMSEKVARIPLWVRKVFRAS